MTTTNNIAALVAALKTRPLTKAEMAALKTAIAAIRHFTGEEFDSTLPAHLATPVIIES